MNEIRVILLILSFLLFSNTLLAAEVSYLCSAELSSGYEYNNGRWSRDRFRPDDKYKIQQLEDNQWSLYEYKTDLEYTDCKLIEAQILECEAEGVFAFNLKTMKFSFTSTASYVHSTRRNRDPIILTLGTCLEL